MARSTAQRHQRGFSTIELLVVVAVISIISAVALPSFMRAYQTYQVNDAASKIASILKFTRYESIRLNATINCLVQPVAGGGTVVGTDSNGSGVVDVTEKQVIFATNVSLIPAAGVPGTGALVAAAGLGPLTPLPAATGFDKRGALNPPAVYVAYVGNTVTPNPGYRAVILLPSGSIQLWSSDSAGNWHAVD